MNGTVHRRSAAVGVVAALFGLAGRTAMPGTVLVALLGDLGTTPAAARRLLGRMREHGQLTSRPHGAGRGTEYVLAGAFAASVERVRDQGDPRTATPEWTGSFDVLLHAIPESHRAVRDRFRRAAVLVGYAPLQPGVLIGVADRVDRLEDVLADLPDGARVRHASLAMPTAEAAAAASEAWELPALAADLAAQAAALRAVRGTHAPAADATTLRVLVGATQEAYVTLLRDPGLPAALQPAGWPGDELRAALGELARTHVAPARRHLENRLDEDRSRRVST